MTNSITISKDRVLSPALDYHFLRKEGLNYVEKMAHTLWTDYNAHDPGITILEAICYAITELGYRSNFPIQDLLANEKGFTGEKQAFFTPRDILTNEPLTITDYRKMLIDLKGVNNAWLHIPLFDKNLKPGTWNQTEVALYADCSADRLRFGPLQKPPVDLRGLYHVRLDLDEHPQLGDLNSNHFHYTIFSAALPGARISCIMPRYTEMDHQRLQQFAAAAPAHIEVNAAKDDAFGRVLLWEVKLNYADGTDSWDHSYFVEPAQRLDQEDFDDQLKLELLSPPLQQSIMEMLLQKNSLIRKTVQNAWETLHAHRNLCEDWWTVETIRNTPVAVCADIDIEPAADIEQVMAKIVIAIEEYLNPPLRFYSLRELLDMKIPVEEIFEGPVTHNGFLLKADVENARLRSAAYGSDLIHLIMEIEGVLGVRNLIFTAYDDAGNPVLPSQKWCLHFDENHKPVFDVERSKFLFFKENLPYRVRTRELMDTLQYLRGLHLAHKISSAKNDLELPPGQPAEWQEYSSLQHDLPSVYGVGISGLPGTASPERKAQARQLKGYLMFFDQVLAGFFSQLHNARHFFGLDAGLRQSYFQQYLPDYEANRQTGIKSIQDLYQDNLLIQALLEAPDAAESADISLLREQLSESRTRFFDRRNRAMDHLIARFAENFNDYVLALYASQKSIDQQELISDKIRFLQEYPQVSGRRGTAYNITGETWNTGNISGLQHRLARLAGINTVNRQNLFCLPQAVLTNAGTVTDPEWEFSLADSLGAIRLQSVERYAFENLAARAVDEMYENMPEQHQYAIRENSGVFEVYLRSSTGPAIARIPGNFTSEQEAAEMILNTMIALKPACEEEGMHLVEHFLLRPYFLPEIPPGEFAEDYYRLLTVCLPDGCSCCGEDDPYSFRVTIVMPAWPERFRAFGFRRFFERLARREAPAHVQVKVCWLSFTGMQKFETAYREYLEALKKMRQTQQPDQDVQDAYLKASNTMVQTMNNLHSVYPEAILHNCDESTREIVTLGHTSLGSL